MAIEPKSNRPLKKTSPPHKVRLRFKDQEYFIENLALLMKAAVPVVDALDSLSSSVHDKQARRALAHMSSDIEAGYSLANALERSGLAAGQTLALIRLGEASGHLVENLQLAAQQEEKRHMFRAKVRSALIYPSFVLSLTLVVGLGIAWFLLPKLAATFSQLHVKLPLISRVMIRFGLFLKAHGLVVVPAAVIGVLLLGVILFSVPATKAISRRALFAVPGIGRLMREIEIAQFGYLLGTLLDAGLSITKAAELLVYASTAPQYRRFYRYLAQALEDGYSFKEALARYKQSAALLPSSMQQMIVAGERSGSLPEVLLTVGRTYEQKADVTTTNLETIMEPVLLVVVGLGVLVVALAVIVPIYSLVGGLGT